MEKIMKKHIQNRTLLLTALATVFLMSFIYYAIANSTGYANRTSASSTGCSCHTGANPNTNVTLSVTSGSGSFTVVTNSTTAFTVTVGHPTKTTAGVGIAVKTDQNTSPGTNAGTISPGAGLSLSGTPLELVQITPKVFNMGTADFTFNWTAPATPGTYYLRAIGMASDGAGNVTNDLWNWMTVQQIIVIAGGSISITQPVGGEQVCGSKNFAVKWNSTGVNNVKIELSSDGGTTWPVTLANNIPAANKIWNWSVPANQPEGTTYKIRISDVNSPAVNSVSPLSFSIYPATGFSTQPASLSLCTQSTAVFQVQAIGSNLTYQWRKNGVDIDNANMQSLYINNITESDSGAYRCFLNGLCDTALSDIAYLHIKQSPKVTVQPKGDTVCVGSPCELSLEAVGDGLQFSWICNGKTLPGENGPKLSIANVTAADSGRYTCAITGTCHPFITCDTVLLNVYKPVVITQQLPKTKLAKEGDLVLLIALATGTDLKYQWRKDGTELSDKTNSVIQFKNVVLSDSGSYDCVISNRCGKMTTGIAKLSVSKADSAVISLLNDTVDFGQVAAGNSKDTLLGNFITNNSAVPLIITNTFINGSGASDFSFINLNLPVTVQPSDTRNLELKFSPSSNGTKTAAIGFYTNAKNTVLLNLIGYSGTNSIAATDYDFGNRLVNTAIQGTVTITNTGTGIVKIDSIVSISPDWKFFVYKGTNPPYIIQQGEKLNLIYEFTPKEAKVYTAIFKVMISGVQEVSFILKGQGALTDVAENIIINNFDNYPNPANDFTVFFISNLKPCTGRIIIRDLMGNEIKRENDVLINENFIYKWNLADGIGNKCPRGFYQFILIIDDKVYTKGFVVN